MLYVVATPIGHKQDATARMYETLNKVDMVVAEHPDITHQLVPDLKTQWLKIQDALEHRVANKVVSVLNQGGSVALVSDAGTPLISDPGYRVIRAVIDAGHTVCPVPGPSALIAALSVAGLPTHEFYFSGFLPSTRIAKQKTIKSLGRRRETVVFYESPRRIVDTLKCIEEVLSPARKLVVCRELTKRFETIYRGGVSDVLSLIGTAPKGEIVVVLSGDERQNELDDVVIKFFQVMVPKVGKKGALLAAKDIFDVNKNDAYRWLESNF